MAYYKERTISWTAPDDDSTTGYVLYWGGQNEILNNNMNEGPVTPTQIEIGNITTLHIPARVSEGEVDYKLEDELDGDVKIGVASQDGAGNESDILEGLSHFDFSPPLAPTNLTID